MTTDMQMQTFDAAQRLLAEAGGVDVETKRKLERMSTALFWRACGMGDAGEARVQHLPDAARPTLGG